MSRSIKHIGIIRLSAMGDVAMTIPVLRAFTSQNPEIKITVISNNFFKPMFAEFPNISFIAFEKNGRHKGLLGVFRLYSDIKNQKIDALADLHNVLRTKIVRQFISLNGKKTAFVEKGRKGKKALIREQNKRFVPQISMFERYKDVFEKLGFKVNINNPIFPIKGILNNDIYKIIGEKPQRLEIKYIGIAPFAKHSSKEYPLDLMKKVILELCENHDLKIFLFGGKKNQNEILNSFFSEKSNVINVGGKLSFKNELKLISNLDMMLSMDSANAHLAAMYGVKTITLWGATHPYTGFYPYNQHVENAIVSDRKLYPRLPTSVYGNKKIAGYEDAMRTILVDDIVNLVKKNLMA